MSSVCVCVRVWVRVSNMCGVCMLKLLLFQLCESPWRCFNSIPIIFSNEIDFAKLKLHSTVFNSVHFCKRLFIKMIF